ncbi:hypothetical protein B0T20DRAFT_53438 [Sordaria brevicollis]|uniref:DUF4440 domain-containing protein n=1 Tax=Sordaria brevicollis TaxID=83679 RepID=A0AAE0P2R0_SORBR|nr:hypothetical protein B0T20DRAFT_53438 [Sordaria brevicollis]
MPAALGLTTDSSSKTTTTLGNADLKKPNGGSRLDTISKRNHHAAREIETLFWRCLCDDPSAAPEYMAEDCILINPLLSSHPYTTPLSKNSEPSLLEVFEKAEPWAGFRIHGDPLVVEIDLMAVALVYKISLYTLDKKGKGTREVVASVSSSWRQTAGADWVLVAHHCQYVDDE